LIPFLIASIAERIPTNAVIPIAIMSMVIIARKRLALIESRAIEIFSLRKFKIEIKVTE
jgi:hypothetical protein